MIIDLLTFCSDMLKTKSQFYLRRILIHIISLSGLSCLRCFEQNTKIFNNIFTLCSTRWDLFTSSSLHLTRNESCLSSKHDDVMAIFCLSEGKVFILKRKSRARAWKILYNLFKLNTRFLGNENVHVHATILGSEDQKLFHVKVFFFVLFLRKLFQFAFYSTTFLLLSAIHVQTLWEVYYSMIYFEKVKLKKVPLNFSESFFLFLLGSLRSGWCLKSHETRYFSNRNFQPYILTSFFSTPYWD